MPWTSKHHPNDNFIELTLTAPLTAAELKDVSTKAVSLGKELGTTHFLADATDSVMTASLIDVFNLPATLYSQIDAARNSRVALIEPKSPKDRIAADFYELACRNRGWQVRMFADRRSALDWLLSKAPAT